MTNLFRSAALALLVLAIAQTHAHAERVYSVFDLGPGTGVALNDSGHVVLNQAGQVVVWRDGFTQPLFAGTATDINNLGEVTGQDALGRATLVRGGVPLDLGAGYAAAVNDLGVVLLGTGDGFSYWENGTETFIPGLTDTTPFAMNDAGAVVGATNQLSAFLYDSTSGLQTFGVEGYAGDINNLGNFVYTAVGGSNGVAYLRQGADDIELGFLSSDNEDTDALGLNNFDQVVGRSNNRGFLWRNGVMEDINDLLLPDFLPDWTIFAAQDVNDLGDILASALDNQGNVHTVLLRQQLTPTIVPEPSSLALGLIGLACGGWLSRRRRRKINK